MKKLIYIAIIAFISINVNAQIDTISGSRLNWSVIRGIINSNFAYEEERIDSIPNKIDTEIQNFVDTFNVLSTVDTLNINDVVYSDTLLFNTANWVQFGSDSTAVYDKSWNWKYNLGKP